MSGYTPSQVSIAYAHRMLCSVRLIPSLSMSAHRYNLPLTHATYVYDTQLRVMHRCQVNEKYPHFFQICQQWLRQCFWNFLDWDDITLYIATCLIMGIDYQVGQVWTKTDR